MHFLCVEDTFKCQQILVLRYIEVPLKSSFIHLSLCAMTSWNVFWSWGPIGTHILEYESLLPDVCCRLLDHSTTYFNLRRGLVHTLSLVPFWAKNVISCYWWLEIIMLCIGVLWSAVTKWSIRPIYKCFFWVYLIKLASGPDNTAHRFSTLYFRAKPSLPFQYSPLKWFPNP